MNEISQRSVSQLGRRLEVNDLDTTNEGPMYETVTSDSWNIDNNKDIFIKYESGKRLHIVAVIFFNSKTKLNKNLKT